MISSIHNNELFTLNINLVKYLKIEEYIYDKVKTRKHKRQAGETKENVIKITRREKFKVVTYFEILNRLINELEKICTTYNNIFDMIFIFIIFLK